MKIERNDKKVVAFNDIPIGSFFEYENCIYLKLLNYNDVDNAFDCFHNRIAVFSNVSCEVIPLKAKVVIE